MQTEINKYSFFPLVRTSSLSGKREKETLQKSNKYIFFRFSLKKMWTAKFSFSAQLTTKYYQIHCSTFVLLPFHLDYYNNHLTSLPAFSLIFHLPHHQVIITNHAIPLLKILYWLVVLYLKTWKYLESRTIFIIYLQIA